ncbi:MAG: glycoside hydrolase family 140 protein [Armatimonadetes bacterium]|nr:glycoside hydrolase family 140 protein [Armatimonadota bacterium]
MSDNRRFLIHEDGAPFFYLGDTAWELFHRLDRNEADHYLQDRAAKGFTVIQAVVLAELDGLHDPNPYGHAPLEDDDPARPNEAYFEHVDYIVNRAEELGLVIGMLPSWGDKWNKKWGAGPEVFTPENAQTFGEWLGRRYADNPVIWILGGDRAVETDEHRAILGAMAEGLRAGDGGRHLISFHPQGGQTSAQNFHDAEWLDFNMWQSGHGRNQENFNCIRSDYERTPVKPCMDAEPGYEDHPAGFKIENGYLEEYDNRKAAYWALFAGAHGHTYGCHPIWQFWQPGREPLSVCRRPWYEAMHLPGSGQMRHAKDLLLSRPFLTRIPDQSLIASDVGEGVHHTQATRDEDGSYAMIYLPTGRAVDVDLEKLSGETLNAYWYDPRNGTSRKIGEFQREGRKTFTPPKGGPDWVLVIDDASRDYPRPGSALHSMK